MKRELLLLSVALLVFVAGPFAQAVAYAGAAEDLKDGAEKIVKDGQETVKDTLDKAKKEIEDTKENFWEKVPPFIVLPATLIVGLVFGFFLGYRLTKGKGKEKKK